VRASRLRNDLGLPEIQWLPDNKLGALASAALCHLRVHSLSCRGTARCSRIRFGIRQERVGDAP
jgi:hypothetical protein